MQGRLIVVLEEVHTSHEHRPIPPSFSTRKERKRTRKHHSLEGAELIWTSFFLVDEDVDTVEYLPSHTLTAADASRQGTAMADAAALAAFRGARRDSDPRARPASAGPVSIGVLSTPGEGGTGWGGGFEKRLRAPVRSCRQGIFLSNHEYQI